MIDEQGRCCGRKPIRYKRDGGPHLFCPRCDRAYSLEPPHTQISNWAWKLIDGVFIATYPQSSYAQLQSNLAAKT